MKPIDIVIHYVCTYVFVCAYGTHFCNILTLSVSICFLIYFITFVYIPIPRSLILMNLFSIRNKWRNAMAALVCMLRQYTSGGGGGGMMEKPSDQNGDRDICTHQHKRSTATARYRMIDHKAHWKGMPPTYIVEMLSTERWCRRRISASTIVPYSWRSTLDVY